jgi:3-phosphoinositide dependent protein kinase-1
VEEKKLISLEERQHEVHTEKIVLDYLKHCSTVVKLFSTFHDNLRVYFVLEYIPNGSLFDLMKREGRLHNLMLCKLIIAEIVLTLIDLRQNEIIHRDLKPGNILFDQDYHLKLIDFATAKTLNETLKAKIPLKRGGAVLSLID